MPRFYFDFHGDGEATIDNEGCEFASFELAYLDAYRTMIEIGAGQLRDQRGNPSRRYIDVRDQTYRIIATLSFDGFFSRRPTRPARAQAENGGRPSQLAISLNEQIAEGHTRATTYVEQARQSFCDVRERWFKAYRSSRAHQKD